jgi:hypothetical protein
VNVKKFRIGIRANETVFGISSSYQDKFPESFQEIPVRGAQVPEILSQGYFNPVKPKNTYQLCPADLSVSPRPMLFRTTRPWRLKT